MKKIKLDRFLRGFFCRFLIIDQEVETQSTDLTAEYILFEPNQCLALPIVDNRKIYLGILLIKMERGNILAFCTYSSLTTVVRLTEGVTFEYLFGVLKDRWPTLLSTDLRITYSVPGYQSILLENDMDVDIMITHVRHIGAKSVDILVVEKTLTIGNVNVPLLADNGNKQSNCISTVGCTATTEVEIFTDRWSFALTEVGQIFKGGSTDFRIALGKYAIEKGFNFIFKKNDADRVTAKCAVDFCPWIIHARYDGVGGDFYIKKWNNHHECNGGIRTVKHHRLNSNIVASLFEKQVRDNPTIRPIEIKQHMKTLYGLDASYYQAWKGKEKAMGEVQGDEGLAYDRLRAYENSIQRTNPGSLTSIEYDKFSGKFERFFIAFHACIEGFNYCRPVIFLDGTFMKGKYKGIILSATGKNGDQGLYPLCFGVVDAENERNWIWFVRKLEEILAPTRMIVFISDRNKGLLEAVSKIFPNSPHGFCLEHLKQNLRTKISVYKGNKFREMLVSMFTKVVHAHTQSEFTEAMTVFRSIGGSYVEKFIDELSAIHWANAYFPGCRYGELTSNAAESFNSWIKEERCLPIDVMVDQIRMRLMEQMAERLIEAKSWKTRLCPKMEKRLQELMRVVCNWKVIRSTEFIFEIHSSPTCVVDLATHSCGCREWDVEGFPCPHALAAIQAKDDDVYDYCQNYFTTSNFIESYSKPIYPVTFDYTTMHTDNDVIIKPPKVKRPPGRPKRKRGEAFVGQNKKTIRCTRCGKVGNHNRRSCKNPIQ